jgi:signal transduction histidine kinase
VTAASSRASHRSEQHKSRHIPVASDKKKVANMVTVTQINDAPITEAPSLKPFARSLSHELRTPMHGVIGMLDVMHATVQEAIESQQNSKSRNIFQALKENIEVVQGTKPIILL